MKYKLSISVDEDIYLKVRNLVRSGKYRNKSHGFEYAVKLLEGLEK